MEKREIDLTVSCYGKVKDVKYDVVILPWGATEPHNLHLPYLTDCILPHDIAVDAATLALERSGVRCMVMPPVPFGAHNPGQRELPFCIHTRYTTQQAILVVAVTNSPKHDFNRCKSTTCKFLSRDTKSARDKNGTKPRKNKVKNTSLEISLVEYLCFVCKGTNLSLEKRGEIPISLIHNSFSYHCTPNVVIANGFDLKRLGLRKLGVKFCFALCWTFSKTRTGNRTKDLPPLLSNPWFGECLNDRHLTMLNFK